MDNKLKILLQKIKLFPNVGNEMDYNKFPNKIDLV